MANYSSYAMIIKGKKVNVEKLISYLQSSYDYQDKELMDTVEKHFFRVFEANVNDVEGTDNDYRVDLSGYCAWSVYTCMLEGSHTYYSQNTDLNKGTNLIIESNLLNLQIEIFAEEPGEGFMEHYLIENGKMIIDDTVGYTEEYDEKAGEYTPIGGFDWEFTI